VFGFVHLHLIRQDEAQYRAIFARGRLQAVNLPTVGDDDVLGIGPERVAGQRVGRGGGLLVVALHGVLEPLLFASGEGAKTRAGLGVLARAEDQLRAIGRDDGAEGRAGRAGCDPLAVRRQSARNPCNWPMGRWFDFSDPTGFAPGMPAVVVLPI